MSLACPAPDSRDEWVEAAEARLLESVSEARELRQVAGLPDPRLGVSVVLERLSEVRTRLDRVETMLAEIAEFRTRLRVVFKESSARVEDKWNDAIAGSSRVKRTSFGEFGGEAPRERYAKADVQVLGDRIVERRRGRAFDAVNDAFDIIERIRRGLDAFRMDLHAQLRVVSVSEHRLDRTDSS